MAKQLDSNRVLVENGDTLSQIAKTYLGNSKLYRKLALINNISNPDKIYIGQIIKLKSTTPVKVSTYKFDNKPLITAFGLQSNADNTLFATWTWPLDHTDKYETEWYYATGDRNKSKSLIWFVGTKSSAEDRDSTYSIPSNAAAVKFRVKAVSKTRTVNDKEVSYWTGNWSTYQVYNCSNNPPKTPPTPNVEVEKYTLTGTLDNLDVNATKIQFQVAKNDSSVYKTVTANITKTNHASFSCTISPGDEYKVRCRSYKDNKYSDWSGYSSSVYTIPSAPKYVMECRSTSETSVYVRWTESKSAKTYELEYTTKLEYFDKTDQTTSKTGIEGTSYTVVGIETGQQYWFRVRAVNEKGSSAWSNPAFVSVGKAPASPTTWSSTTTAIVGETLVLYWVHNSNDGSSQKFAELELDINGVKETHTIKNTASEDEKDKTSSYEIDTSQYSEGTTISWKVRTSGVTLTYGDWSVQRAIDIYAPPTLQLEMIDASDSNIETLIKFPFYVSGLAGPNTQSPIGYSLSIKAKESYETVDSVGNIKMVNEGEEVYSKQFDINEALMVEFSANNIDLENNISYVINCIVSMNSGLTAESSLEFDVAWTDDLYTPNAEITADLDTLVTNIRPYCEGIKTEYYKVIKESDSYVKTSEPLEEMIGDPFEENPPESVYTTTGELVYIGTTSSGEEVYFCVTSSTYLVEDVTLAVYRREFDGTYTEIAKNLYNNKNTFVTDPHPSLDLARYRIVATTISTGAVSFSDLAGYPIGETSVIIQWDEDWTSFETSNEDEMEKPPWSGSLLKLPYNINVSDKNDVDVSLVKYQGRKHPVSYYGTQLGSSSSWSVEIPKSDKETLYAIRRLSIWTGDVYVREPSGTGYWANIKVSYNVNHCETTIPVSFDITRVEGGL